MKNILVDINHPAHVHLFREFIREMKAKNYNVYVCVKDIPAAKKLMNLYGISYIELGKKSDSLVGKAMNQLKYNWQIYRLVKRYRIDYGVGTSISLAHVSKFTKMKSFVFDDDDAEVQPLFVKYAHPYADYLFSPNVLDFERKEKNHITYPGYHELAYLHPKRFRPDPKVLDDLGIKEGERFFILRFNAFKAHHDVGVSGISMDHKRRLVQMLSEKGKVFITTETAIDQEFEPYKISISPEKIHSALYYASMLLGDSQTMTSEAAVLGTPSLRCNSFAGRIAYLEEEEHTYGLTKAFKPDEADQMLLQLKEWLADPEMDAKWKEKRSRLLQQKIDVSDFFVWFIDNYPESVSTFRERNTKALENSKNLEL